MNGQTAELELVIRARGGDRGAYGELVTRHWVALVRLARSVVGDGEAEDAVQDGLVAAWRRLASVRDPEAFRPWVTRVVARCCLRRARRRVLLGRRFAPLAEAGDPPAPGTEGAAAAVDVPRLLAALAPRQRAVLHLTVVEGMSDSEIGHALGITAASVRSHRRRARQRLDQILLAGSPAGQPLPSGGSTP